jgi:hypothetical protein
LPSQGRVWRFFLDPLYTPRFAFAFPLLTGVVLASILGIMGGWRGALLGMALGMSLEIPIALRALFIHYVTNGRKRTQQRPNHTGRGHLDVSESEFRDFGRVGGAPDEEVSATQEGRASFRSFALRCAVFSGATSLAVNLILSFTVLGVLYLPVGMVLGLCTGPLLYIILWLYWKVGGEDLVGTRYRW